MKDILFLIPVIIYPFKPNFFRLLCSFEWLSVYHRRLTTYCSINRVYATSWQGWGEKGDWWLIDRRVDWQVVSPVDAQWCEKTRDPYKIYGGWVGGIRRISTLLPSLRSVLSPYLSLSLSQPDSLLNIPEAWRVYSIKLPLDNWCAF